MAIYSCQGDLLDQRVDAIVNPWNRNIIPWWLLLPQGVSGAIKARAGNAPFRELARHARVERRAVPQIDAPTGVQKFKRGETCDAIASRRAVAKIALTDSCPPQRRVQNRSPNPSANRGCGECPRSNP